jgi:hypothetical protein
MNGEEQVAARWRSRIRKEMPRNRLQAENLRKVWIHKSQLAVEDEGWAFPLPLSCSGSFALRCNLSHEIVGINRRGEIVRVKEEAVKEVHYERQKVS